jgi:4-hydroxy-tetrahydrodipicolinate synthase
MTLFSGSGTAIITPFNTDGSINYDVFAKLINFQIENGTDAIIVCGTTGEASTLTDEEQLETIQFAVATVNKRVPVIAGAGSNHTSHGIDLCKGSQKAGADACLLVTPYYNKTTQKGLIEHFTVLANSIDIPIILYNVPSRTGLNINPKTYYELSKVENIIGIKEASGNISHIADVAELCNGRLDLYSGNDEQILPVLSLGGKGVISVIANIAPRQTHDLVVKYMQGDLSGSLDLQLKMLPLIRALFSEVNPIPVKTALGFMGYEGCHFRQPLTTMTENNASVLEMEMKAYGLL